MTESFYLLSESVKLTFNSIIMFSLQIIKLIKTIPIIFISEVVKLRVINIIQLVPIDFNII